MIENLCMKILILFFITVFLGGCGASGGKAFKEDKRFRFIL
jgi:hypothetical protein